MSLVGRPTVVAAGTRSNDGVQMVTDNHTLFQTEISNNQPNRGNPAKLSVKVERIISYSNPQSILVLTHRPTSGSLHVSVWDPVIPPKTQLSIINNSSSAILSFFSNAAVSSSRLIYITAGLMFDPASPLPFGGPKTQPGYVDYFGTTVTSLLRYLVGASFKWYWACRGRAALDFLARSVNKARKLHFAGNGDLLNKLMLKGMKKAGHIEWSGSVSIPEALRHRPEAFSAEDQDAVAFTPRLALFTRGCKKEGSVAASWFW
ncbi:hypothetical protein CcCBS67573_g08268 [Chytriomyces confervae]|uniref:Uncharacterized protein n=1 Tax=Chytriomyces confervae TaxID=246404 RepID=A0A507EM94_9FUNG|nr:hypothetical protein CcCBS67573_g08268 [Chytriomyces confervae]